MSRIHALILSGFALTLDISSGGAVAQVTPEMPAAQSERGYDVLLGRWVRPDGGYAITITGVGTDGKLDAGYANPSPLPFAKAEASRDGKTIKIFLELRAGGYAGSTYTLTYDPVADRLAGIYFQAVAQHRFNVYFVRVK
jgi:hypothetical protein